MDKAKLAQLRAVAQAASPGPWMAHPVQNYQGQPHLVGALIGNASVAVAEIRGAVKIDGRVCSANQVNADYLTTFSPDVLLQLIDAFAKTLDEVGPPGRLPSWEEPDSRGLVGLEPDAEDLRLASTIVLKSCPFCDQSPETQNRFRPDTGVYRSVVSCTGCMADVGYNARSREEARRGAIAAWERREGPEAKGLQRLREAFAVTRTAYGQFVNRDDKRGAFARGRVSMCDDLASVIDGRVRLTKERPSLGPQGREPETD